MSTKGKILFVASLERHLKHFHVPYIQQLQRMGYEVHTAASGENMIAQVDTHFNTNFSRSPLGLQNLGAYWELKKIIGQNKYALIHCHTPVASLLTRLAARGERKHGTRVMYTAHGFHFYDGGEAVKNFVFKNVERFASGFTDCLVTINAEDEAALGRYQFKPRHSYKTNGVGIEKGKFHPVSEEERLSRREALGIGADDFVLIYSAEYSERKNHRVLFEAVALLNRENRFGNLVLILPGLGPKQDEIFALAAKLGIADQIKISGYRSDVDVLLSVSDVSVAPSKQEGLPTHVLESMASGLPCIVSRIRGHVDLIEDGVNGLLYDVNSPQEMAEKIRALYENTQVAVAMGSINLERIKPYFLENTVAEMMNIYDTILSEGR